MGEPKGAPSITTRNDAVDFLNARIGHGVKPGLERISALLEFMGDPQKAYPSIHVAGTNGKTTVARMVQQILGAHGLATGGFTSPHLHTVEERFTLHGVTIDEADFTDAVKDISWFVEAFEQQEGTSVTYFEVTAALAFSIFATGAIDIAVVEAINAGAQPEFTDPADLLVHDVARELLATGTLSDEIFEAAKSTIGYPCLADAVGVIGHFSATAMMGNVAGAEAAPGAPSMLKA